MKELFHKIVVDDYKLKLAALLVAALVWFVQSGRTTEPRSSVRAELRVQPPLGCAIIVDDAEGRRILGSDDAISLRLDLSGPKSALDVVDELPVLKGLWDLSNQQVPDPGEPVVVPPELEPEFFEGLRGVTITSHKKMPRILLDTIIEKEDIPVRAQIVGKEKIKPGYELVGDPVVIPTKITVKGPSSLFTGDVVALTVPPIDVGPRTMDSAVEVYAVEIDGVTIDLEAGNKILVNVNIDAPMSERVLENVPLLLPAENDVALDERWLSVRVKGPPDTVNDDLTPEDIRIYVDIASPFMSDTDDNDTVSFQLRLLSPPKVELIEPKSVTGKVLSDPR